MGVIPRMQGTVFLSSLPLSSGTAFSALCEQSSWEGLRPLRGLSRRPVTRHFSLGSFAAAVGALCVSDLVSFVGEGKDKCKGNLYYAFVVRSENGIRDL